MKYLLIIVLMFSGFVTPVAKAQQDSVEYYRIDSSRVEPMSRKEIRQQRREARQKERTKKLLSRKYHKAKWTNGEKAIAIGFTILLIALFL